MGDAVRELTHDLCQWGPAIRKLRAEHLSWTQDMSKLFGWITSQKVRADAKGVMTVQSVMPRCQKFPPFSGSPPFYTYSDPDYII